MATTFRVPKKYVGVSFRGLRSVAAATARPPATDDKPFGLKSMTVQRIKKR